MANIALSRTVVVVAVLAIALILVSSQSEAFGINIGAMIGVVINLAVIVGIVLGIVWLINNIDTVRDSVAGDRAVSILRERFARGEISRSEYFQLKQDLEADN